MQFWVGDAVVLDVVFPSVFAVGDFCQQFIAIDVAAFLQDSLEAGLDLFLAEALEQPGHAACAHQAGLDLAVEIGRQHFGHAGVAADNGEHGVISYAFAINLHWRNRDAFLEHGGSRPRHRTGHPAADVVVMTERLDVGDHFTGMEHRHRAAEIGQVPDRAFR